VDLNDRLLQSETIARRSLSDEERKRYEALSSELSGNWEPGPISTENSKYFGVDATACEQVAD
jgi:hypothetical protein